ncbi:hypothetical protein [Candidatus Phytoplasma rubi]|uniref:hypothetical protein n=1 Tax=Candidatus Phytoplasma rubi TaxID=399025 RepID=UPI0022863CAD|nr:hypothetical protein [Candidatus Phytoplasma rubi]
MSLNKKIYLSLIGLLSLSFLILLIFDFINSHPSNKNPTLTNLNLHQHNNKRSTAKSN